jgi:alkanesulfonate monooxygenase SsuD/methylene tetrahydromethanopterin reductase-like flavin-dependent oxidoreductase (luciferase family)
MFSVLECPPGRPAAQVYPELLDLYAYGETLGFTHAWVAEHHFSDYGTLGNPAVFLAALASRTTSMRLGSAVSVLPFHDPVRVAEDYAALDVLSGGRLEFGVGRGYQPMEFAGFGIDMATARDRFWEQLDVIRAAWAGEAFSYAGEFYRYPEIQVKPKPVQDPVPIHLASVSPETFDLALAHGYEVMGSMLTNSAANLGTRMAEFRSRLPEGATATLPIMMPIYVAESMDQALDGIEQEALWYFETVGKLLPKKTDAVDPSYSYFTKIAERTGNVDYAKALLSWPIGDVERVAEFLVNLARASTSEHFIGYFTLGAMETGKAKASMERFMSEVVPLVQRELG